VIEREHQQLAWHAWHVAALQRIKTMPTIDKMLGVKKPRQSWQQDQATMAMWAAAVNRKQLGKSN